MKALWKFSLKIRFWRHPLFAQYSFLNCKNYTMISNITRLSWYSPKRFGVLIRVDLFYFHLINLKLSVRNLSNFRLGILTCLPTHKTCFSYQYIQLLVFDSKKRFFRNSSFFMFSYVESTGVFGADLIIALPSTLKSSRFSKFASGHGSILSSSHLLWI